MQHQQQHMLARRQAHKDAHAAAARAPDQSPAPPPQPALPAAPPRSPPQPQAATRAAAPSRICCRGTPSLLREDRAQALVPRHQVAQRSLQRSPIKRPAQPHRQRDRVARPRPLQPVQKPQPPLRIRQRKLGRTRPRLQRRTPRTRSPQMPPPAPQPSVPRTGCGSKAPHRASRGSGRSAASPAANGPQAQRSRRQCRPAPAPEPRANSPQRTSSCGVRGNRRTLAKAGSGAGSARRSSLPLGVSGSRIQHHKRRRNHVVRQAPPKMRAQPRSIRDRARRQPPPHSRPAACRRPDPRAQSPPPAPPRDAAAAPPRSRPARSGTRAASPAHRRARGSPAPRPGASAPGPRSGTSGSRPARTGPPQTAPPSARNAPDSRAPAPHRQCKAPRKPPQAPAQTRRPEHKPACSRSDRRSGSSAPAQRLTLMVAQADVVSVGP